jgi:hypothetical protein
MIKVTMLATAAIAAAIPAIADDCMEPTDLQVYLEEAFAERPIAVADHETGSRVRLFTSKNGTWTLVQYNEERLACVVANGTGWFDEPPAEGQRTLKPRR